MGPFVYFCGKSIEKRRLQLKSKRNDNNAMRIQEGSFESIFFKCVWRHLLKNIAIYISVMMRLKYRL